MVLLNVEVPDLHVTQTVVQIDSVIVSDDAAAEAGNPFCSVKALVLRLNVGLRMENGG